jgi:hypothetical protein
VELQRILQAFIIILNYIVVTCTIDDLGPAMRKASDAHQKAVAAGFLPLPIHWLMLIYYL